MCEEVQRSPAAERHPGHGVERVADVMERRLEAEREQDDAGDHRQVEVAVRVSREPARSTLLACMSRLRAKIAATSK